jgi:hypothetical protein
MWNPIRESHKRSPVRAAIGASLVGIAVVCAGCTVSKSELKRDSDEFVPPGGYAEGFETETQEGEADNRLVGYLTVWAPGTKAQRYAAYLTAAQKHGWTCTDGACTKDGVEASVRLGVALPQSNRQIYDEIELDGQWYGALP